jgi:hypothetical protein
LALLTGILHFFTFANWRMMRGIGGWEFLLILLFLGLILAILKAIQFFSDRKKNIKNS